MYDNSGDSGSFVMTGNTTVSFNRALMNGGGVMARFNGLIRIAGSAWVHHNIAGESRGGLGAEIDSELHLSGDARVSHNKVSSEAGVGEGGGIGLYLAKAFITGRVRIDHNSVWGGIGGGLNVKLSSACEVSGYVRFFSNVASGNGGGICVERVSSLLLDDHVQVTNNSATFGGGLYILKGSSVKLRGNVLVEENLAEEGGGAFVSDEGADSVATWVPATLTLQGGAGVRTNSATVSGGGISCVTQGIVVLEDHSDVSSNIVHNGGGGGISGLDAHQIVVSRTAAVTQNVAATSGGGISVLGCSDVRLRGFIASNRAYQGGGLFVLDSSVTLETNVTENVAVESGGGVGLGANARLAFGDGAAFFANRAFRNGGGLCIFANNAIVETIASGAAVPVWSNHAEQGSGGGFRAAISSSFTLINWDFQNNKAGQNGGAVSVPSGASLAIDRCSFNSGYAERGGGLAAESGASLDVTHSAFSNNQALVNGGSIFGDEAAYVRLVNCDFANESAAESAGSLFLSRCSASLNASSFTNCSTRRGNGGALLLDNAHLLVNNSRFYGCAAFAGDGGAAALAQGALFTTSNTAYELNRAPSGGGGVLYFDAATCEKPKGFDDTTLPHASSEERRKLAIVSRLFAGNAAAYGNLIASSPNRLAIEHGAGFKEASGVTNGASFGFTVRDALDQVVAVRTQSSFITIRPQQRDAMNTHVTGATSVVLDYGRTTFAPGTFSVTKSPAADVRLEAKVTLPNGELKTAFDLELRPCYPNEFEIARAGDNGRLCQECPSGYYLVSRSASTIADACHPCPANVECGTGSSVSNWQLSAGYWRAHNGSIQVFECRFGHRSCPGPGDNQATGSDAYCASAYTGPRCAVCAHEYFLTSGNDCLQCNQGGAWLPTIIGAVFVICVVVIAGACIVTGLKEALSQVYKIGKTKFVSLIQVCQVISQFAAISRGTGSGLTYAEPAASFTTRVLAFSNLDLLSYLPLACSLPSSTFYHTLLLKTTILPLGPVALLWIHAFCAKPDKRCAARQSAARFSLLWVEMVLTNVSTTIGQTFVCEMIDNKSYLRVEPTLTCDSSATRRFWKTWSILMMMVYPVGFPLLLTCLLLPERARIRELMEELHRQSSIAQRKVSLAELSSIQRDSNYEETKLVVKYRQGKEALAAFDRKRRLPALVFGVLCFCSGSYFMLSTFFFGGPLWFGELFIALGLCPGPTVALLALLPSDGPFIKKLMRVVIGIGSGFGCLQMAPVPSLSQSIFDNDCIDYRGVSVPCWCSALQVVGILLRVILIFEVIVRRPYVSLASKKRLFVDRLELLWGLWARFLVGFAVTNTLFVVSAYLFFADGRAFLSSTGGTVSILTMVEVTSFGYLASRNSMRSKLQACLAHLGTVTDPMAIATLMMHGDEPLEEIMVTAKERLRYVTLSSMDMTDFNSISGGAPSRSKYAKSVHCRPRDVDIFVSHSHSDSGIAKWEALTAYCDKFMREVCVRRESSHRELLVTVSHVCTRTTEQPGGKDMDRHLLSPA